MDFRLRKAIKGFGIFTSLLMVLLLAGLVVIYQRTTIPDLNAFVGTQATVVTFQDGTEIGRFASENRVEVQLSQVPVFVQRAVLAAEDSQFFNQPAFSLRGIARAALNNIRGGELQGGSTITQQYVKVAYLTPERTLSRKFRELMVAIKLESRYSKSEILERYLNAVYFGRGAYGIETASNQYFDKSVSELTLEEAIALASILRSPGSYDPDFKISNKDRLIKRFALVANNMLAENWISTDRYKSLKFPYINPREDFQAFEGNRGHLLQEVRRELISIGYSDEEIQKGGLRVETTLIRRYQSAAEEAVRKGRPKGAPGDLHIGLAAVQPGTGQILALYGGPNYLERQLNSATQAITQAGSTFKVFGLVAALERGIPLSSIWDGKSPQTFYGAGAPYTVSNYGNTQFGKTSLLRATANSINTVFVRLGYRTGFNANVDAAKRAGIPEQVEMLPTPSFVLGVSSPRVLDVASAFSTFAAEGIQAQPFIVKEISNKSGKVLFEQVVKRKRSFSKAVSADVTYALRSVVQSGTATGALYDLGRPAAGKTGTSQNNASAWFTGYTPQISASVALFRDDATESLNGIGGLNSVTGGSFPARIWKDFVKKALEDQPIKYFPNPAFIGGIKPIDLINPSPTPTPSKTKKDGNGGATAENKPKLPKLPGVTTKPIPLPTVSSKRIP